MKIILFAFILLLSAVLFIIFEIRLRYYLNDTTSLIKLLAINPKRIVILWRSIKLIRGQKVKSTIRKRLILYDIGYVLSFLSLLLMFILIALSDWRL